MRFLKTSVLSPPNEASARCVLAMARYHDPQELGVVAINFGDSEVELSVELSSLWPLFQGVQTGAVYVVSDLFTGKERDVYELEELIGTPLFFKLPPFASVMHRLQVALRPRLSVPVQPTRPPFH